uniref:Pre-SET domain-containing protein n=1 Tax=Sciurus vulgaris TaxID=55149 RepID=A0A8D2JTI6_SCIVU
MGPQKRPFGMAASEKETEALTEELDVARGLENLPVSAWPPGAWPAPFQYTPDHVLGPGADVDPAEITFPGCTCVAGPCVPGTCSCLRRGEHYDGGGRLRALGSDAKHARPVFECNVLCGCGERCGNRVVQRGLQFPLQVFLTERKGWGLRALERIPAGRFVCWSQGSHSKLHTDPRKGSQIEINKNRRAWLSGTVENAIGYDLIPLHFWVRNSLSFI